MLGGGQLYSNTAETDAFLDRKKLSYIGGMLEFANSRLYPFWGSLTEALRIGQPQNEIKQGLNFYAGLYADESRLKTFLKGMTGISMGAAAALADKFPWKEYQTFIDIGAAQGGVPVRIATAHKHLAGGGFDLPPVGPIFEKYVKSHDMGDRLQFYPGDFFKDSFPEAEVLVLGHILHNWNLEEKKMLLAKAYQALPKGGALIVYEAMIDDARKENAFGLLMSLNMLIETSGGFDYTGAECVAWMRETGFRETRVEHLTGPDSMVIGIK